MAAATAGADERPRLRGGGGRIEVVRRQLLEACSPPFVRGEGAKGGRECSRLVFFWEGRDGNAVGPFAV